MVLLKWLKSLLFVSIVLVVLIGCKPDTPPTGLPQSGAQLSPSQMPASVLPAQPLPTAVLTDWAPGTPIVLQEGRDVRLPMMTPLPTITPYPTVTPRPGPTATSLPLPKSAQDATGSIAYVAYNASNNASIYSVNTNRAGELQNTPKELAGPSQNSGDFVFPSFDGSRMAIVDNVEAGDVVGIFHDNKIDGLFKNNLGGSGNFLNWHPDNRHVLFRANTVYSREGDYPGLWLVDTDTGTISVLIPHNPPEAICDAVVSPDGREIIYSLQPDTFVPAEVWTSDASGRNTHLLFTAKSSAFAFAWSPDGKKLAFIDGGALTVINADGSNPRILSNNFTVGYRFRPVWSPDSKTIAFVAWDDAAVAADKQVAEVFNGTNIHLIDVDSGKERSLLSDHTISTIDPAWSPDGLQMAFASARDGGSGIWTVNIDGTNLRSVTPAGQFARFPFWRGIPDFPAP